MIITLVCDVLGGENNGTTIATMNLKRFLEKQKHTVKILCADQSKIGLENYFVVPNLNFGKVLNGYVSKVGISLAKPKEEILRQAFENSDIVHIMLPLTLAMKSVKVANEMNIPITAGFHMQAENFTSYVKLYNFKALNKVVYKFIYKHTYKYAKAIHYPTKFIKDIFEKNIKKSTNGYVISNGVNAYVQK